MAIVTLAEVKAVLGLTSTAQDTRIETLIPMVESDISQFCNRTDYPAGMKPTASLMVGYLLEAGKTSGKQSETIGTYSYAIAAGSQGYPDHIYLALGKWAKRSLKLGTVQTRFRDSRGYTPEQLAAGKLPSYAQEGQALANVEGTE